MFKRPLPQPDIPTVTSPAPESPIKIKYELRRRENLRDILIEPLVVETLYETSLDEEDIHRREMIIKNVFTSGSKNPKIGGDIVFHEGERVWRRNINWPYKDKENPELSDVILIDLIFCAERSNFEDE